MPIPETTEDKEAPLLPTGAPLGALEDDLDIKKAQSTDGGLLPPNFDASSATGGRDSETGARDNVSGFGSRRADVTFGENNLEAGNVAR